MRIFVFFFIFAYNLFVINGVPYARSELTWNQEFRVGEGSDEGMIPYPETSRTSRTTIARYFAAENWVVVVVVERKKLYVRNMEDNSGQPKRGILRNKSEDKHQ